MLIFKSLSHRPFALLWSGQTISRLGDSLYQIALAWWVLQKTGSATAMGNVLIFSFLPTLLVVLVGGVTVDRLSRTWVMLLSDIASGIILSIVAVLAFNDLLEIWHLYIASTMLGFATAFFHPAYTAAVPEVLPSETLLSANSLTSLSKQLSRSVGPLIGAAIVQLGGVASAFAFNGISFFISAACLIPMLGLTYLSKVTPQTAGVLSQVREGITTVLRLPWLWISITIISFANLTQWGPILVSLPFLIQQDLNSSIDALAMVYTMLSVGSVVSALWLGRMSRIRHRGLITYTALIVGGIMTLVLGIPNSLIGIALASFLIGASSETFNLIWTQTMQEMVPREVLGRVASIDYLGSFVLVPVGYALAGWATDRIGASLVFIIGGILTAALAGIGLIHPTIRRLD